jgi:hypothetical protein
MICSVPDTTSLAFFSVRKSAENCTLSFSEAVATSCGFFVCTSSMAQPCGDGVYNLAFDPSGKFLLAPDTVTNTTPVFHVDVAHKKMEELSSYLPGSTTPVFSHDGRMVYTIQSDNKTVLITTFDPATGELGANSSLPILVNSAIFSW